MIIHCHLLVSLLLSFSVHHGKAAFYLGNPSIHYLYRPSQGLEKPNLSNHQARGGVAYKSGQLTTPLQGNTETQDKPRTHTLLPKIN